MKTLLRTYKHHLDQRFSNWVVAHKLPELEHMGHENAISKHIITDMASVSLPQIKWGHYMITLTHFNPPSPPPSIRSSRWSTRSSSTITLLHPSVTSSSLEFTNPWPERSLLNKLPPSL